MAWRGSIYATTPLSRDAEIELAVFGQAVSSAGSR